MLFTHKDGVRFLERARIHIKDGRLVADVSDEELQGRVNIPIKNIQALVLGNGTSLSQAAAKCLNQEGVTVVFAGAMGQPVFYAPVTGYKPTQYARQFIQSWFEADGRLNLSKRLFQRRVDFTKRSVKKMPVPGLQQEPLFSRLDAFLAKSTEAQGIDEMLGLEGQVVRQAMYGIFNAVYHPNRNFVRNHDRGTSEDVDSSGFSKKANELLNHGNALAYALASGVLYELGIPPSFPLLHGLTRNGGLIFDVADIIKDGAVIPWAFEGASKPGQRLKSLMDQLRHRLSELKAADYMIESMKSLCMED